MKLRLYVWTNFSPDYTCGLAFAIATSKEEAVKMVEKKMGHPVSDWGTLSVYPLTRRRCEAVAGGG
jgi:hypothetical protein